MWDQLMMRNGIKWNKNNETSMSCCGIFSLLIKHFYSSFNDSKIRQIFASHALMWIIFFELVEFVLLFICFEP